ncbi:S-adenosyl-L-methionine-dependent methyltransferase [Chlamydoabsidia padenii]|nr:S-adenosyl-L-methionine-dependent methyltransferase [Chlamydoabsidia padenii]
MGSHQSKDSSNGEKRRRRKINTLTNTTSTSSTSLHLKKVLTSSISTPAYQQQSIDFINEETNDTNKPKYSPFYKRSNSPSPPQQQQQSTASHPVNPVRHQVVLSDQVTPLSSLASVSRHLRRSNSKNDTNNNRRNDHPTDKQSNRRFSIHRQKSGVQLKQQDYDATSAISGMTSEDDDIRSNPSLSRSGIYASSIGSSNSMHPTPTQAHLLTRRLSTSNDNKDPSIHNKYGTTNTRSTRHGNPIVFDTSLNMTDPTTSHSSSDQQQQQTLDRMYDYGHEKEYNRQMRQHYVLKQVFGKNIIPELDPPPRQILDSACGIGLWTWETSQQYRNSDVVGIDINLPDQHSGPWVTSSSSSSSMSPSNNNNKNIIFMYGDILKPLPFEDNHFDFIHQREAALFIPSDHWGKLLNEFHRILKVGGMIQLVEQDIVFKNPGPVLAMINEWYRIAADGLGVQTDYNQVMEQKLLSAGFDQVNVMVYDIPIGEWSNDPVKKQHGFLYKEQIKALFKSVQRYWLAETGITQHEYNRICSEAMDEFEDYNSSVTWKIYTAKKPPTSLDTPPTSGKQNKSWS